MAFLDNSGDIILDAVLTDAGRARLAKGDGSFKITKFALGDDEINYTSYNKNHSSGSAYYDLEILQTPVLEAFTNNTSGMKSKLMSIPRTNLLYLPVMRLNGQLAGTDQVASGSGGDPGQNFTAGSDLDHGGGFWVFVDQDSADQISKNRAPAKGGMINGVSPGADRYIRVDQGLDTIELPNNAPLDSDLVETQFIVEIDSRLGQIVQPSNGTTQNPSFIDDDMIASYYFSAGANAGLVKKHPVNLVGASTSDPLHIIRGPVGNSIEFTIGASLELQSSTYLFEKLGSGATALAFSRFNKDGAGSPNFRYIDTNVRVVGVTTGCSIDIPVRFMKKA